MGRIRDGIASIFGINEDVEEFKSPEPEKEELIVSEPEPEPVPSRNYYDTSVLPLVLIAEQKVRDRQEEKLEEFRKHLYRQLDGYEFSCTRYGDFLTLSMTKRVTERNTPEDAQPEFKKFVTTVNLGKTSRIDMTPGRVPGLFGETRYYGYKVADGQSRSPYSSSSSGYTPPGKGFHFEIYPSGDVIDHEVKFLSKHPPGHSPHYYYADALPHVTKNTPAPSVDDMIEFYGTDVVVLVPYGRGQDVFECIQETIRIGFEPKGIAEKLS